VWAYYSIRAKSFWFFSSVNPTLAFSGFEGETKQEMFEQLPKQSYPTTIYVQPNTSLSEVTKQMKAVGLDFPIAVKPDIGTKGLCFRKIENEQALQHYHNRMPVTYLVQNMIEWPFEASVFYVRYPHETSGRVTGFIAKEYLHVVGDGKHSLQQLIQQHHWAKHFWPELKLRHTANLKQVIPAGEAYLLSQAGNHNRGARFINLQHEIDTNLIKVFDAFSLHAKHFFYGRFDVKATSLADLKKGSNLSILEFNGVGSEPNHIYDCNMSYTAALKTIVEHWHHMYHIGKLNNKQGVPYMPFIKGIQLLSQAKAAYKRLEQYDAEC
jgi:hypothetical protein